MKISVITVTRNCLPTLRETIASVASQEGADIEHIVVDGASTDGTVEYLRACPSITRWVSEPDGGIYFAMNKGLAMATGEYVGFLNADDVYASNTVVQAIAAQLAATNAEALYGDLQYVDAKDLTRVKRHWTAGVYTPRALRWGWMPPHPTFYVRRKVATRLCGFDTRYRISSDYDFMVRCLASQAFAPTYARQVLVRMRSGGASNGTFKSLLRKSAEDLHIALRNGLGITSTVTAKILRKIHQLI